MILTDARHYCNSKNLNMDLIGIVLAILSIFFSTSFLVRVMFRLRLKIRELGLED